MHSLLPATMKLMSAVFNDIHNANDHRAPKPRVYLFSAKIESNQVHQLSLFVRSAHAVNDTWVLSNSLLVSRC